MNVSTRVWGVALCLLPAVAFAQNSPAQDWPDPAPLREITLEEALGAAREGNADLAVARAEEERAQARARGARSHLLPQVDLSTSYMRTTDPVGAFGTKLRQGIFGMEDLAIDPLNDPDAITDWSSAARVQWNILSPRVWAGRASAAHQAEAGRYGRHRTADAVVFRTKVLYYEARRAEEQMEAARSAEEAARATLDRFRRRHDQGLLTRADLLQAEAELASTLARRRQARQTLDDAREDLALHLGWNGEVLPRPVDAFDAPAPLPPADDSTAGRADLLALEAGLEAAESAQTEARLRWLPDLGAYAAYVLHDDAPLGSEGEDWTLGVTLRWQLFTGWGRSSQIAAAEASARIARHKLEQARREARSDVSRARRAVQTAHQAYEATRTAADAAGEGRDLMRRRFEEGMATSSDLLQAEARAATMRSAAVDALAGYHMALAQLDFARSENLTEESR